ncbi:hypothetical protein E2C01_048710 [Portunus trituberculatus]|uniref:Uncharacterized protein n=1 Tax=Portunus trituberculatus TaxID=210409 RepID=A0A5B7GE49_PORTR|nr:hypothetical protein [Portunus trituberculatus]
MSYYPHLLNPFPWFFFVFFLCHLIPQPLLLHLFLRLVYQGVLQTVYLCGIPAHPFSSPALLSITRGHGETHLVFASLLAHHSGLSRHQDQYIRHLATPRPFAWIPVRL